MKSPLVDALRQSRERASELELEDSVRLDRTDLDGASNDDGDVDAIALTQTTTNLVVVEVEVEVEDERDADAGFDIESEIVEAEAVAAPVVSQKPDGGLERAAVWTPLLCLLLGAGGLTAVPLWDAATDGTPAIGGAGLSQHESDVAAAEPLAASPRFEYLDLTPAHSPTPRPAPVAEPREPAPAPIQISVRERAPVGSTHVDVNTFSTLGTAYQAYLAGDMSQVRIEAILADRVRAADAGVEVELKVMLQRYPDQAPLHRALGTLLADSNRWPEAQLAFSRADALGGTRP